MDKVNSADKTFEIYNVCLEELCGQFYLMDLAFHSRVVRKLFHNYKHQLHNIMKYQLTLQKELNLKYQQEKQMKQQIQKLEDELKTSLARPQETASPTGNKNMNFADEQEEMDKKLAEMKKQHEKMRKDAKLDEGDDKNVADEIKNFLNKDFKVEDNKELREQLMSLLSQIEKEREKLRNLDPNSETYLYNMKKKEQLAQKKLTFEVGFMTDGQFINANDIPATPADNSSELTALRQQIQKQDFDIVKLREELDATKKDLENKNAALDFQEGLYNEQVKKCEQLTAEVDQMSRDNSNLAQEVARQTAELEEKEGDLIKANGAIQVLREELNTAIIKINELKDAHQRELDEQKKTIDDHENTIKRLTAELAEAQSKYEGLLKGGDHADNQTKGFITNLETQVLELKKSSEKNK